MSSRLSESINYEQSWSQILDTVAAACDAHLADLAKAHKAGCGELHIPGGDMPRRYSSPLSRSPIGSVAAMCADFAK